MVLFTRKREPGDLEQWRDGLREAARAERERLMKFKVRKGFENGFSAGDIKGKTGEVVQCSPERGQQLKTWLEPAEPFPWEEESGLAEGPAETEKATDEEPPGAPPKVNASLSGEDAGGKGRKSIGKGKD